jgi:hypothetical protein
VWNLVWFLDAALCGAGAGALPGLQWSGYKCSSVLEVFDQSVHARTNYISQIIATIYGTFWSAHEKRGISTGNGIDRDPLVGSIQWEVHDPVEYFQHPTVPLARDSRLDLWLA